MTQTIKTIGTAEVRELSPGGSITSAGVSYKQSLSLRTIVYREKKISGACYNINYDSDKEIITITRTK